MRLSNRLAELREELAKGEQMLADAEREVDTIRAGLLRISGAIQVLEELQAGEDEQEQASADEAKD